MTPAESPILQVVQAIELCNSVFRELPLSVEGEVGSFSVSRGQFVFFDLKDEHAEARISCFMMASQLSVPLENGMRVLVYGVPGLYQKSGAFRLTLRKVEPRGEGSLQRAFSLLQEKLAAEGLFQAERKRKLPRYVKEVGLISSSTAAGFEDFMRLTLGRLPGINFHFVPVAVQGEKAVSEICQAITYLNQHLDLDVITLLRGGGSIEDLHAFNDERVVRAIVGSKAPILIGVGHERDTTIADLAADVRAATPSNAAQLLLPDIAEIRSAVSAHLSFGRQVLSRLSSEIRSRVSRITDQLPRQIANRISYLRLYTERTLATIIAVSPQSTLERGYTLTLSVDGTPIRSAKLDKNSHIQTRFADGVVESVTL